MDILEQALQDLHKQLQKVRILSRGFSRNNTSLNNMERVKTDKKSEVKQLTTSLTASSHSLSHSVKGAFGKKLTITLDNQSQLLDTL